jgi:SAM-dependent methyltransferase
MASLRDTFKRLLPKPLRKAVRRVLWAAADAQYRRRTGRGDFPPADLRILVWSGGLDIDRYFASAGECAHDITAALERAGKATDNVRSVLDFGCGCARVLSVLAREIPQAKLYGTDVYAKAIAWSEQNVTGPDFGVNRVEPPLPYADGQFDTIYSISVFTHIDERMQDLWLAELRRVAKPGAVVILTVHGPSVSGLAGDPEYQEKGFKFLRDEGWSDYYEDFYQTAFHTQAYVERHWSKYFTVVDYATKAMGGLQDVVILRRA